MTKIIFVCLGNTCRSPMAEFVMKNLVARAGLEKNFVIESAGCAPSIGAEISEGTVKILREKNIPFRQREAKELLASDYKNFDYLIGLSRSNVRDMKEICGGDPDGKIFLMMDFAGDHRDVVDPWGGDGEDYEITYRDVLTACKALLEKFSADYKSTR